MREYSLNVEYKAQKDWAHAPMWVEMACGGVFCGMFVACFIYRLTIGILISFLLAVAGKGILLLIDLGKPGRFLRVLSRPGASWISRGTWGFGLFALFGLLAVLPVVFSGLPWEPFTGAGLIFGSIACALAIFVMVYDGFLLTDSKGIAVWTSGSLPLLFGINAALGGIGATMVFWPLNGAVSLPPALPGLYLGFSVLSMICVYAFVHTAGSGPAGARHSISRLTKGDLTVSFWGGTVGCGILIPILVGLLAVSGTILPTGLWIAAGLTAVIGVFATRYSILKCGEYSPVI